MVLKAYTNPVTSQWVKYCDDIVPSVLWGLLNQHQVADWFNAFDGQQQTQKVSMHDIAQLGPSGALLGKGGSGQGGRVLGTWPCYGGRGSLC